MRKDLNENFRDISDENKSREQKEIDMFDIVLGLLIGGFLYFAYYTVMTEYFKANPFRWPYILISIYFVVATILFPYANNRVSAWVENSKVIDLLFIPQTSILIAYIFAPIFFIYDKLV